MPDQVKQFGLDQVPKSVKLLLDWFCEAMKLSHSFGSFYESLDVENEITVNDTAIVQKLLKGKRQTVSVERVKELWDLACVSHVRIPLD